MTSFAPTPTIDPGRCLAGTPPLSSHSDHKTEVMERDGDKKMPLSSEMRVVIDEKVKGVDHEKTRIMVKIGTTSSMPAKTAKQWPKRYAR